VTLKDHVLDAIRQLLLVVIGTTLGISVSIVLTVYGLIPDPVSFISMPIAAAGFALLLNPLISWRRSY